MEPTASWDTLKLAPAVLLSFSGRPRSHTRHLPHRLPLFHFTGPDASGLTSEPTRFTSPTALITLHKASSDDATMLDAIFMKSLSTTKRVIALTNNNLFAGFYVIMPHKCIHPIFQPQRCTLTDLDTGVKHEFLVGQSSNNPRFLHAEYIPVEVADTFVCLVDTC
jgi:hypothetical protein